MECKGNSFIKMKVNLRVSRLFSNIISEIPYSPFRTEESALVTRPKNSLILYEDFYSIVYRCVLEYIPKPNENPLFKAIKKMPNAIKNFKRISENRKIIEMQQTILDKYFYVQGEMNIRNKIDELQIQINELIEAEEVEYLDSVLERFEDRMQSSFLKDMKNLSQLLEKRERKDV